MSESFCASFTAIQCNFQSFVMNTNKKEDSIDVLRRYFKNGKDVKAIPLQTAISNDNSNDYEGKMTKSYGCELNNTPEAVKCLMDNKTAFSFDANNCQYDNKHSCISHKTVNIDCVKSTLILKTEPPNVQESSLVCGSSCNLVDKSGRTFKSSMHIASNECGSILTERTNSDFEKNKDNCSDGSKMEISVGQSCSMCQSACNVEFSENAADVSNTNLKTLLSLHCKLNYSAEKSANPTPLHFNDLKSTNKEGIHKVKCKKMLTLPLARCESIGLLKDDGAHDFDINISNSSVVNFKSKSISLYNAVIVDVKDSSSMSNDSNNDRSLDDAMEIDLTPHTISPNGFSNKEIEKILEDLIISVSDQVNEKRLSISLKSEPDFASDLYVNNELTINHLNSSKNDTLYDAIGVSSKDETEKSIGHDKTYKAPELKPVCDKDDIACSEYNYNDKRDFKGTSEISNKKPCSNTFLNNINHNSHFNTSEKNKLFENAQEYISKLTNLNPSSVKSQSSCDANAVFNVIQLDHDYNSVSYFSTGCIEKFNLNLFSGKPTELKSNTNITEERSSVLETKSLGLLEEDDLKIAPLILKSEKSNSICNLNELSCVNSNVDSQTINSEESVIGTSNDNFQFSKEMAAHFQKSNVSQPCSSKEALVFISNAKDSQTHNSSESPLSTSALSKIMSGEGFLLKKCSAQESNLLKDATFNASKERSDFALESLKKDCSSILTQETRSHCIKNLEPPEEPKVLVQMLPIVNLNIGQKGNFSSDVKLKLNSTRGIHKTVKSIGSSVNNGHNVTKPEEQEIIIHGKRFRKKKIQFELDEPHPYASKTKRHCSRVHGLNFHIQKGRGLKLKNIENISCNLGESSPSMLRILHYVLFGTYGQDQTDTSRKQTIRNILHFSGFSFWEDSLDFEKKHACLTRVPLPVLVEIHSVLLGGNCKMRSEIVKNLLSFFMQPERCAVDWRRMHPKNGMEESCIDHDSLKNHILRGPVAVVVLEKLKKSYIKKMTKKGKSKFGKSKSFEDSMYCKPAFIFDGPGIHLKKLRKVCRNVSRAHKDVISLLHFILYGRTEDIAEMRRNILEFNGFSALQKEFAETESIILSSLTYTELQQICDVLSIYATGKSKRKRVNKILKFLCSPYQPPDLRTKRNREKRKMLLEKAKSKSEGKLGQSESKDEFPSSKPNAGTVSSKSADAAFPLEPKATVVSPKIKDEPGGTVASAELQNSVCQLAESIDKSTPSESNQNAHPESSVGNTEKVPKLGNFEKIRQNVECATPNELLELNDLLLLNPSDECEIHQNILQSTQFTFSENSIEFRARKMVLHYLPLESIKKVARLLDIQKWEKISTKDELSTMILKFLSNMTKGSAEKEGKHDKEKKTVHILKLPPNSLKESPLYKNIQPLYYSPMDDELEAFIMRVVTSGLWSCKDEDLMELVLQQYPIVNLEEKKEFIKIKAKDILLRTRKKAFDSLAKTETWYSKLDDVNVHVDCVT